MWARRHWSAHRCLKIVCICHYSMKKCFYCITRERWERWLWALKGKEQFFIWSTSGGLRWAAFSRSLHHGLLFCSEQFTSPLLSSACQTTHGYYQNKFVISFQSSDTIVMNRAGQQGSWCCSLNLQCFSSSKAKGSAKTPFYCKDPVSWVLEALLQFLPG